jgi:dihydropteroate synthase
MEWRAKNLSFRFPRRPIVMGVLNVTPDSFSDGSHFLDPGSAVDRAFRMVDEGADMVDIGGESTRPGATPVGEAEELRRLLPVLERLGRQFPVPISVDTRKSTVARVVLEAGASLINDIEAARGSEAMWQTVASAGAGYVAMHMQGTPQTMQLAPTYGDVVAEINDFFSETLIQLKQIGVEPEQVALDPGIGFGKTVDQNLKLLTGLDAYKKHHRPIVLGVSRKSFLGKISGGESGERLSAALACTLFAASRGCSVFRTHDVLETVRALRMWEALAGQGEEL